MHTLIKLKKKLLKKHEKDAENKSKANQTFVNKVQYSKSLYCLLKLQIFINWNDHITQDRDSYEQLKTENKIEIN